VLLRRFHDPESVLPDKAHAHLPMIPIYVFDLKAHTERASIIIISTSAIYCSKSSATLQSMLDQPLIKTRGKFNLRPTMRWQNWQAVAER
jgi:hypothetical protein